MLRATSLVVPLPRAPKRSLLRHPTPRCSDTNAIICDFQSITSVASDVWCCPEGGLLISAFVHNTSEHRFRGVQQLGDVSVHEAVYFLKFSHSTSILGVMVSMAYAVPCGF